MTLPASIRVNTFVPFPSLVTSSGPIAIQKTNGIWTISLNTAGLVAQVPPIQKFATDFIIVFDQVTGQYVKVSLATLGLGGGRPQRSVTAAPVVIGQTDQILNLNLGASTVIALPSYLSRSGVPLTFKDAGRQAGNFPITISALGAETIDGAASVLLRAPAAQITLTPYNDGVNAGWGLG